MINLKDIRKGMQIFGANNQAFGTVEDVQDQYVIVNGQRYEANAFTMEGSRLMMAGNRANTNTQTAGEIRVPVAEEQLNVGKREVGGGAVSVHKTVTQEQVNVPVELYREEAHIEKVDTPDRPLRAGENAFKEETFEIPLRAEEAVVSKEAIVTGEVVVNKTQETERRNVTDTIRKERVEVDRQEATAQRGATYETTQTQTNYQPAAATAATTGYTQTNTTGRTSGQTMDYSSQIQEGYMVYGSDEDKVGKVKSMDQNGLLVNRGFLQGDTYVPLSAIAGVTEEQVMLNVPASQIDDMGA